MHSDVVLSQMLTTPQLPHLSTPADRIPCPCLSQRVLSRPEEEFLPDIFSSLGLDYDERVLPSIGNEVLKAVVAQYNAESLICLLYTSPSPRDRQKSRMPSSA